MCLDNIVNAICPPLSGRKKFNKFADDENFEMEVTAIAV